MRQPRRVRALEAISTELGCHSIYALAHLAADNTTIRYARAVKVAKLAEEWEAEYLLTHQKPPANTGTSTSSTSRSTGFPIF
jgi:hypothetical protein